MSERRSKAESGEGAEESSSQRQQRPSDPLHPSPPHHSYYMQQSSHFNYPLSSSARRDIGHYAVHRSREGGMMPPHHGSPHYQYGPPPVNPRLSPQYVTPDSRRAPIPAEFTSPPSEARRRFAQSPPSTGSKHLPKRPRRSGTFS